MTEILYLITTEETWVSLSAAKIIYTLYTQVLGEVTHLLEYNFKKFLLCSLNLSAVLWHLVKHKSHFILMRATQKEKSVIFIFYLNTFLSTYRIHIFKGFNLEPATLTMLSY